MNYMRAIISAKEYSMRALEISTHAITLNPSHYSIWQYRRKIISALEGDLLKSEYDWLVQFATENQKNYQVWYHRQWILSTYGRAEEEFDRLNELLQSEPKNYHLWSFRCNLFKFKAMACRAF